MTSKQLEKRVAKLESELERLKDGLQFANGNNWRAVVGTHESSSTFDSVVREMRRLRHKDYEEATDQNADF